MQDEMQGLAHSELRASNDGSGGIIHSYWWLRAAGWIAAGLAAGWLVSFLIPARYTSTATLRLTPGVISQSVLPRESLNLDVLLSRDLPNVYSISRTANTINTLDLYPHELDTSMNDLIEKFQKITPGGAR